MVTPRGFIANAAYLCQHVCVGEEGRAPRTYVFCLMRQVGNSTDHIQTDGVSRNAASGGGRRSMTVEKAQGGVKVRNQVRNNRELIAAVYQLSDQLQRRHVQEMKPKRMIQRITLLAR